MSPLLSPPLSPSQRDTVVANPNGAASDARPGDASVLPLRFAMHTAMNRATSDSHYVLRNARSKLTSTNQRIPCTCHDFPTPSTLTRTHATDFLHRATKSSSFSCRARCPAPATQNDARRSARSHPSHACHTKPPRRTHQETCWRHAEFHLPLETP